MLKLVQRKRGLTGLILAVLLLATLILIVPAIAYGDGGIGEPSDGLNSTSPSGTGDTTTSLESLALFVALSLVT
ncbi:MAG: hypothetical protein V1890_00030 [Candidatus Zixiibacteriota bacterium]